MNFSQHLATHCVRTIVMEQDHEQQRCLDIICQPPKHCPCLCASVYWVTVQEQHTFSSLELRDLLRMSSVHSLKQRSTRLLYIFRLYANGDREQSLMRCHCHVLAALQLVACAH